MRSICKILPPRKLIVISFLWLVILPVSLFGRVSTVDFIDGLFRTQIKEHNLAGLTFSLFSADTLDFTRSYGHAQVETGRKTDENTGFMIGSVSKLFVWVSVMQLYEQGIIDLNRPVNDYLTDAFRLPESYLPVTMIHLMTHTPGFSDRMHIFTRDYQVLPELQTYLEENLPSQIFEPGTVPAYSNYGSALAAYVVEQITGVSFSEYVEENIFAPLQMHNTTFHQPASYAISEARSRGYIFQDGRFTSPFEEFVKPAPAGSAVSSAADMKKFMKALLICEDEAEVTILENETISQMLSLLDTPHPKADGIGYGFLRMDYHGKEIFWHGGGTYFFQTMFVLVPHMNTGIFFSVNTAETRFNGINQVLLILDYLNGNKKEPNGGRRVNGMNKYAGTYQASRTITDNYHKIVSRIFDLNVSAVSEGLLVKTISDTDGGTLFTPHDDDVFISGHRKLIFNRDEFGEISMVILSDSSSFVFLPVSFRANLTLNAILLIVTLLIVLRNLTIPVIRLSKSDKRGRQTYRWLLFLSGGVLVLFIILFISSIASTENVIFERPSATTLILLLPWASALLFLFSLVFWIGEGIGRRQPISATFWQFAGFLALVVFYLQLAYWNLFNFWT